MEECARYFPGWNQAKSFHEIWEKDQRSRTLLADLMEKIQPPFQTATHVRSNLLVLFFPETLSQGKDLVWALSIHTPPQLTHMLKLAASTSARRVPDYARLHVVPEIEGLAIAPLEGESISQANVKLKVGTDKWFPVQLRLELADPTKYAAARHRQRIGLYLLLLVVLGSGGVAAIWQGRLYLQQLQLNQLQADFVSSVSHELRTPVASVRLLTESLISGRAAPEKTPEYLQLIAGETRRLTSLLDNVLDFSRIERGTKKYRMEESDLVKVFHRACDLIEPLTTAEGVVLERFWDRKLTQLPAFVDGEAILQAFINLIDNAIKHSPPNGVIRAEIKSDQKLNEAILSIGDQGPGIPAGEISNIFKKYYRLGSELRRETKGIGIGLSIVKHIVETHRGRVEVESLLGKGSTFRIVLPTSGGLEVRG
jgi:signal transduction histidine kinase